MEQEYYLDCLYLRTIQDTPYTASQLRTIIEERVPCGPFGVIQRELGLSSKGTLGSGSYIKSAKDTCSLAIVTEQGACLGLMASLFPDRPVQTLAASH